MDHSLAKSVFEEIQARPYGLSPAPKVSSNNCYYKGIELLQKLATLGYTVRGQVGETFWNRNLIPGEILDLLPADILITHFYPEVMVDGEWRIIDPSFQSSLAQHGFYIGSWKGTERPCFEITKLYSQQENIDYQQQWSDPDYAHDFFTRGAACWKALNEWFAKKAMAGNA